MDNFTPIPDLMARRTDVTAAQKMVWGEIARMQNNPQITEIWVGYEWVAERVGMTERAVGRAVAGLVERGLLIVEKRAGRTHRWHANGPTAGLTDDDASSVGEDDPSSVATSTDDDTSSPHTKMSAPPRTYRPRTEDDPSDDESIHESISKRVDQKSSLSDSETESRRRSPLTPGQKILQSLLERGAKTILLDDAGVIRVYGKCDDDGLRAVKDNRNDVLDALIAVGGQVGEYRTVVATPGTAGALGSGTTG